MVTAQPPGTALMPRQPGGLGAGFALSVGVHALLLAALGAVVQWRTQSQVVVAAELWSSIPQTAAAPAPPPPAPAPAPAPTPPAPTPPAPPPPAVQAPRPPDIALERERERRRVERERQERLERERLARLEREKQERLERERRERQAAEQRQERERRERLAREAREREQHTEQAREETLRRMMAEAGGRSPRGTAAHDAAPSASYVGRLRALIRGNTFFSGDVPGNPAAEVEVRTGAGGVILSRRLIKSSGQAAWDDAVLRAIDRTARLPPDADGRVPPALIIAFRPKEQ